MNGLKNPDQAPTAPTPIEERHNGRRSQVGTTPAEILTFNQETLRRVTGLIQLGFGILNGLIGLRFLLKLMASNPDNIFASLVYTLTQPFLWIFVGLTRTPSFEGIVIEFYDLVAIVAYGMMGWVIIRMIWLLFGRLRSS